MDAPFPDAMMPDIEKFFREVHPTLKPGQDWYPEVFATDLFFPLQRPKELAAMIRAARKAGPPCEACGGCGLQKPDLRANPPSWPLDAPPKRDTCPKCVGLGRGPVTVMEIGADKSGGLYHWCMCLPTVRNVIACEIRGTPYKHEFDDAFPNIDFLWLDKQSSYLPETVNDVEHFSCYGGDFDKIDVLFIDGDKLGMLKDFDAYLPLMRRPGGVVFIHDISDDHPKRQFEAIVKRGYKVETIVDRSEGIEAAKRGSPRTSHEAWLVNWGGRSCGVGVVQL